MRAAIRICAQCRTVLLPGESRCLVCGADSERLTSPCPLCGHEAPLSARFCTQCGYELQPPAASRAAPQIVTEPEFVKVRNPGTRAYLGIGATVLVVLVLVAVHSFVAATFFTPQRAVTGYFDALAARDAGAALSYLAPGQSGGGELLTDAVLRHEGYRPPLNISVGDVPAEGDRRVVPVGFELDGKPYQLRVVTRRANNRTLGVFRGWLVEDGLLPLNIIGTGGAQATVNGVAVPDLMAGRLAAFPGQYRVGLVDNPLLQVSETTATVAGQGGGVRLSPKVKDSARTEVDAQVRSYVDECARRPELRPLGCPFAVSAGATVIKVKWAVSAYPVLTLTVSQETGALNVSTAREGKAQVTGSFTDDTSFVGSDGFRVNGTAALSGGKVRFTPR